MNREPEAVADEWLVLRAKEGSAAALEDLLKRWRKRLWLHSVRVIGNEDAAQDVVQEALLAIARGIRQLEDPSRFPAWAYRIVTFKGRDWIRAQVRQRQVRDEAISEAPEESEVESGEQITDVREALSRLPEPQRDLLRMRYHLGLSIREIADIEGVPIGTIKSRLHQARAHLKTKIQPPNTNEERP